MRTLLARVVDAIPRDWLLLPPTSMRDSRSPWQQQLYLFISSDTPVSLNDAVSRTVCRRLLQQVIEEPSCIEGWRKTNPSVRSRDLHKLWDLPKVCKVSLGQDRDLHWKLIHRVLPSNRSLFHCGLSKTDACPSCNLAPDTTEHIFGECPLWQKLVGLVFNLPSLRRYRIIRRATHTHFIQFTTRCKDSLPAIELSYLLILLVTFWRYRQFRSPQVIFRKLQVRMEEHLQAIQHSRSTSAMDN